MPAAPLNGKSVERILSATGINGLRNLDEAGLCASLNEMLRYQKFYEEFGHTKPVVRKWMKRFTDIESLARQLHFSLTVPGDDKSFNGMLFSALGVYKKSEHGSFSADPQAEPFNSVIVHLEWLIEVLGKINLNKNPGPLQATELFITVGLAKCYEKHLHRRAGKSKSPDGTKVGGPFIRFVQAVQKEAGIPISTAKSIETYIKRSRRGDKK